MDAVAESALREAVGDDATAGPVLTSLAAGPAVHSPELEAVEQRLAALPDEWKSPDLVSELRRAARAACSHRRLAEAHNRAAVKLAEALAAELPDMETAADLHLRVEALDALRQRLDTPEWHADVMNQLTGAAAHRLVDPFGDITFISLVTAPTPEVHVSRQGVMISPTQVDDAGRPLIDEYLAIRHHAAAWVAQTRRHLDARTAHRAQGASVTVERTPDPVPWLARTADLASEGASIVARAQAFESSYPPGANRSPLFPPVTI